MIVASVIPCSMLGVIGICYLTGWNIVKDMAIVSGITFIALLMTTWWWWAMTTLNGMTKNRTNSVEVMQRWFSIRNRKLERLETELKTLRSTLKETVKDAK